VWSYPSCLYLRHSCLNHALNSSLGFVWDIEQEGVEPIALGVNIREASRI
jgi:hypothetical protein